jgi:hypothetical protein
LLILGDPGSGKTTTLLELARDRIALAEKSESEPIPVVFNLSSWADDRKPLFDWLVAELNTKYGVPRKVAKIWVEQDELLLLLDGLDEVLLRYRDQCVQAINEFRQEHGFARMVVCSRITDYEALSTQLKLNGAIVIQPLNEEQIDQYLRSLGSEYQGVREAMTLDADLNKLAETPLMLSIMTLAFRGIPAIDLPPLSSLEAQRRRLFGIYTQRMFERRTPRRHKPQEILHYLKWLAGRMVERKQSVFYIENLQIDWIAGDAPQRLYRIVGRTVFGVLGGALLGAVGGIGLLVAAFLLGQATITTAPTVGQVIAVIFGFLAVPAGCGGLLFALSGLQAYALDTLKGTTGIRPIRSLVRRCTSIIGAGMSLGLLSTVLLGVGLFIFAVCLGNFHPENASFYNQQANQSITGWPAVFTTAAYILFIAISTGAYAGAACAGVAFVIHSVQYKRRFFAGTFFLAFLGIFAVLVMLLLFLVAHIAQFALVSFSSLFAYPSDIATLVATTIITAPIMSLLAYIIPKRIQVTPYVLLSLGVIIFFLGMFAVDDVMTRGFDNLRTLRLDSVIFIFLIIIVFAVLGTLVGRINDHIESADTLKWRWNWRWAGLGLLGMLGLGIFLLTNPIQDQTSYTREGETQAQARIAAIEPVLERVNARRAELQSQWEAYRQSRKTFTNLEGIITEQAILESVLTDSSPRLSKYYTYTSEQEQFAQQQIQSQQYLLQYWLGLKGYVVNSDTPLANAGCYPIQALNTAFYEDSYYYYIYYVYSRTDYIHWYSPPFMHSTYIDDLSPYTAQLAGLRHQLAGEQSATQWVETRQHMLFCDWQAARLRGMLRYQRLNYTQEGIQEQFVSVLRITLALGLAFIVMGGVVGGVRKSETIDIRTRPNQGIRRTLQSAVRIILIFAVVGLVVGGVIGLLLTTLPEGDLMMSDDVLSGLVPLGMILGVCSGISLGLLMGGIDAVVKHIILRLFLQRSHSIPRNYAALLDESAALILLRKVGGGYIFIHRYLLEYYASLEGKGE